MGLCFGRRTQVARTGSAFTENLGDHFDDYDYNPRNELTDSTRTLGTPQQPGDPVPDDDFAYDYDPIGNRKWSKAGSSTTTYTSNELNQYAMTTAEGLTYDDDGNVKEMYVAGDIDGDDKTDQADLGILLADWGCGTGP
ncbi:MAG TPA: hypothetical protein VM487_11420 [Phycisphaerae bacterium]|nr:hypothetical protein [Phycisphaerae bacterium]